MSIHFFDNGGSESLDYETRKGQLWFVYHRSKDLVVDVRQRVPQRIVQQGKTAIRAYVKQRIAEIVRELKRIDAEREAFRANPNITVSVTYKGMLLEGRVESGDGSWLCVRLEKPEKYAGKDKVQFGQASAMNGHYIWSGRKLSKHGLKAAHDLLIRIYRKNSRHEEPKDLKDLADKMNDEEDHERE